MLNNWHTLMPLSLRRVNTLLHLQWQCNYLNLFLGTAELLSGGRFLKGRWLLFQGVMEDTDEELPTVH